MDFGLVFSVALFSDVKQIYVPIFLAAITYLIMYLMAVFDIVE